MITSDYHHDVVLAGGGLCGLATAWRLHQVGHRPLVLEASSEVGGRIQSFVSSTGEYLGDRGPSWIWPDYQPVARRWFDELGVRHYAQYIDGQSVLDHGPGHKPQVGYMPAQLGSERLVGGTRAIIDALSSRLPEGSVRTGTAVVEVADQGSRLSVRLSRTDGAHETLETNRLVLALPPRIALASIDWHDALPPTLENAMRATPTWMAAHAKAVIVFERAFWRDAGLSGRIASTAGPLGEVHDHCGPKGKSPAALFGFFSWPVAVRREQAVVLETAIREQLARAFGPSAPAPVAVLVEDWADRVHVTTDADLRGPMMHPEVSPAVLRESHLSGRLWLAGAECAARSPGLIDGALDAADAVSRALA